MPTWAAPAAVVVIPLPQQRSSKPCGVALKLGATIIKPCRVIRASGLVSPWKSLYEHEGWSCSSKVLPS